MKKLLLSISVLLVAFAANAQNPYTRSFVAPNYKTLIVTNGLAWTNLLTATTGAAGTNNIGNTYTNALGTRYAIGGTNDASVNAFVDLPLYADRNGNQPGLFSPAVNVTPYTNNFGGNLNVNVRLKGGSGANSAVSIKLVGLPNGVDESTASGDIWTISVTASTTAVVDNMFPVPIWMWPGASKLRVISVINADTDASSEVYLLDLSLNGFQP